MHVILDDLRAEDRVGVKVRVQEQEWERKGGWANGLRFDGDATDKTECSESTALSTVLHLPTTYRTVAQARTDLQGTGTGTDRRAHHNTHNITCTHTHTHKHALRPWKLGPHSGGGARKFRWGPHSLSAPLAPSPLPAYRRSGGVIPRKTKETAASARQR